MTDEEKRLAIIANAYRESKGLPTNPAVMGFSDLVPPYIFKLVLQLEMPKVEKI